MKRCAWSVMLFVATALVALLAIPGLVCAAPGPQGTYPDGERRYFDLTGHYVHGPFLEFFDTRGGLSIFGYPQTEVFYEERIGLWVQYFDNARMEWHPENPDPYKVQLGLLGEVGIGSPRCLVRSGRRTAGFGGFFQRRGTWCRLRFWSSTRRMGGWTSLGTRSRSRWRRGGT